MIKDIMKVLEARREVGSGEKLQKYLAKEKIKDIKTKLFTISKEIRKAVPKAGVTIQNLVTATGFDYKPFEKVIRIVVNLEDKEVVFLLGSFGTLRYPGNKDKKIKSLEDAIRKIKNYLIK